MNNEQGTAHCILLAYFFTRAILSDDNVHVRWCRLFT